MDSDRTGWRSDLLSLPSPVEFTELGQLCAIGELSRICRNVFHNVLYTFSMYTHTYILIIGYTLVV